VQNTPPWTMHDACVPHQGFRKIMPHQVTNRCTVCPNREYPK
jgi:hypothetical protein